MRAIDVMRSARRVVALALSCALAVVGCSLNPQPDDPNAQASIDPKNAGGASGAAGFANYGGLPTMVPPGPGAGGTVFGGTRDSGALGGGGPIVAPRPDAAADRDAGSGDAGDAGDARPDRDPTRD